MAEADTPFGLDFRNYLMRRYEEQGRADPTFHIDAAIDAVSQMRTRYELLDAGDRLAHDIHDGAHIISGAVAYDWFERWMK